VSTKVGQLQTGVTTFFGDRNILVEA